MTKIIGLTFNFLITFIVSYLLILIATLLVVSNIYISNSLIGYYVFPFICSFVCVYLAKEKIKSLNRYMRLVLIILFIFLLGVLPMVGRHFVEAQSHLHQS